ncbi:MAG: DUF5686 and carboxypeptidase regulatory-like domain-containing protein [Bacteroidota bacterium]
MRNNLLLLFLVTIAFTGMAQRKLTGVVTDENNLPIPFADIYVKNNVELRTQTDVNGNYSLQLFEGEYYLIFTAMGYDERETYVTIQLTNTTRDIQLFPSKVSEIEEVEVTTKKSNPGREIMLKVVKQRDQMNQWNYPHSTDVYIKATEKIERKQGKQNAEQKPSDDPFEEERRKTQMLAGNMNLAEVQAIRYYAPQNKVKEIRNAFTQRGDGRLLYYTTTVKSNFNFFENLMHLDDLHASPVSSPISGPGILSYKYRLEAQYEENGHIIDKIKIIPRSSSTSTLSGYIYIIDSLWLVQKLELTMEKGNLLTYDYFTIEQQFDNVGDTLCVLREQLLTYGVKYKEQTSTCTTLAKFSNYDFNPEYAKKFFTDEVAITSKEAYERDSAFWKEERVVSLTPEEQRFIIVKDSLRDAFNRKEYLDSIDAVFNKVTVWKVLWFGVDHRNRPKRTQWSINSVAALARPLYPAGPRVAPGYSFFRKWEDQRTIDSYSELSVGILNGDLKGSSWWRYLYDPFHQGKVYIRGSHEFDAIVPFDAITQVYKRSNFIEVTKLRLGHDYEYFNGFYINVEAEFAERRSLSKYQNLSTFDSLIPNDQFKEFEGYQALLGEITVSYTPKQKYMREPYRKVILGSKFPTFYAYYQRGIPKLFGSDVDHEYAIVGVQQSFQLGTLGTSNYHFKAGKFLSSKNLKDADFKYQRRSTPLWFANPLYSFQAQDSSLPSKEYYLEAHFVHHDNGAIINKIPFMKKTGIGLVFGVGALYVAEYKYQYYEMFTGLERSFKFSKRRLRIGIYAVASDGNTIKPRTSWKISFAVLDDRNMKWNF